MLSRLPSCSSPVTPHVALLLRMQARCNLQNSQSSQVDSFLRIQAVAFKSAKDTGSRSSCSCARGCDTSHLQQQPPCSNTWKGYHMIDQNKEQHVEAVGRMDEPDDWQALLEIGAELAAHFEADIRRWVRKYLLCLPDADVDADAGRRDAPQRMDSTWVEMDGPAALLGPYQKQQQQQQQPQVAAAV